MPRRNIVFANNEIYHVFNRSIAKENIFSSRINLRKALEIVEFYRFPQRLRLSRVKMLPEGLKNEYFRALQQIPCLVEIYSFAFMPNHYHFLLKQLQKNGINRFISNFQNSFAKVFNLRVSREGSLFQHTFKAKRVETDEEYLHISRYIHLNPVTAYLIEFKDLADYLWTSFPAYVKGDKNSFVNTEFLLNFFQTKERYIDFVADQVDYQRGLALIKDLNRFCTPRVQSYFHPRGDRVAEV